MNCYGLLLTGFGGQIVLGPGVAKEASVSILKLGKKKKIENKRLRQEKEETLW